ncbi:MAG: hypothetical protein KDC73_08940 [Ignavibacteriae bacterium]|nr:hypothetical protein [Ignavibacteriota bacterium]MCB9242166.1 hypothetical protein [Ignavibacteriales bacterium]
MKKPEPVVLSREEIIAEYQRVKTSLGYQPSQREFVSNASVTSYNMVRIFRTYSRLVRSAGDTPQIAVARESPDEEVYFEAFGQYLRAHRALPAMNDWIYHGISPGYRSFLWKFKCRWSEFPYIFLAWASVRPAWKDVLSLIPPRHVPQKYSGEWGPADLRLLDSIPPILHDITRLAFGDGDPAQFEKQCALALRVLGFEVHEMGSLAGRNPDGIARDARERFAVIYDAKSRKDYYTIGTDDRQFTEYILSHKKALDMQGFQTVFFLIISGRFGGMSPVPFQNVQLATGVTLSCITAENLLRIIASKILKPLTYDTAKIKQLLITGGEVTKTNIEKVFKQ